MVMLINSGKKSGLRDWLLQRFTGIYMTFYFLFIIIYLMLCNNISYLTWFALSSSFFFKIFTIIFMFSLVLHSSIGMSIIFTDYVKLFILRLILDIVINVILLVYIFSIMQILWSF